MHGCAPAPQSGPPSQIQSCCDAPGMQDTEHRAEIVVGNSVTFWKCSKISSNVHLNSCWKAPQSDGAGVRRVNRRQSLTVDVVILVEQHHRRLLLANDFPECPRSQLVDAGPVDGTRNISICLIAEDRAVWWYSLRAVVDAIEGVADHYWDYAA